MDNTKRAIMAEAFDIVDLAGLVARTVADEGLPVRANRRSVLARLKRVASNLDAIAAELIDNAVTQTA